MEQYIIEQLTEQLPNINWSIETWLNVNEQYIFGTSQHLTITIYNKGLIDSYSFTIQLSLINFQSTLERTVYHIDTEEELIRQLNNELLKLNEQLKLLLFGIEHGNK